MPTLQACDWDSDLLCWHVVLSDGLHTWHGRSVILSFAFAVAFTRYIFDDWSDLRRVK